MKETPDDEKYPVSEEEMGNRYKSWTESLGRPIAVLYRVGKEVGGEKFVERPKEEYYKQGRTVAAEKRADWMKGSDFQPHHGRRLHFQHET